MRLNSSYSIANAKIQNIITGEESPVPKVNEAHVDFLSKNEDVQDIELDTSKLAVKFELQLTKEQLRYFNELFLGQKWYDTLTEESVRVIKTKIRK